ncbi:MAG: SMP-30/gluconolactonase/LRE family protein [Chitinophagaceae bacterium]
MVHPALVVYTSDLRNYYNTDFEIKKLDNSCSFSEGPVWHPNGFYLFSDIPENVIYQLTPGEEKKVFLKNSGCTHQDVARLSKQIGSNGLALNEKGELLICQHGNHCVAILKERKIEPLISEYKSRPFNSPNDLVIHDDGSVFFSDPPYGLMDQKLIPDKYQSVAGVYCWREGGVQLFCDQYQYPNGVCLSPDKKILYTCSNKDFEPFMLQFNADTLQLISRVCKENGDGIKCDRFGNILLCNKEGVVIVNKVGKRLALLKLETIPANVCWGGSSKSDLFVTARENIFMMKDFLKP